MAEATRSSAAALPVRAGEELWTEPELEVVREELEAQVG